MIERQKFRSAILIIRLLIKEVFQFYIDQNFSLELEEKKQTILTYLSSNQPANDFSPKGTSRMIIDTWIVFLIDILIKEKYKFSSFLNSKIQDSKIQKLFTIINLLNEAQPALDLDIQKYEKRLSGPKFSLPYFMKQLSSNTTEQRIATLTGLNSLLISLKQEAVPELKEFINGIKNINHNNDQARNVEPVMSRFYF